MLTDNEIKRVAEDALGFKAWARTLEEIACSSKTPITIGVYGEWGSGKTSLMRMTEDLLQGKNIVKTVWFDAWKFDKTHDLRVALINAVLRKIQNDTSIREPLKEKVGDLLKRVNWLGLGKIALSSFLPLPSAASQVMDSLIKSFLKNPEDIPEKTHELIGDFEDEFKELVKEYVGGRGRLIVFIDDLDRCIPEKAIDVLEAIKLFLNVQGSVFIIGADKKVIENGILQIYGEKSGSWGRNYLDKIIQIPVNLPPLRKDIITEQFIFGLDVSKEIEKYAEIIAEAGDNPRTIKRLLNRFEIQRILAEKKELKVESRVMAKLIVIEFRWPDFYTDLISIYSETGMNLIQILKEISKGTDIEGEKRLEEWKTFKKYFDDKGLMKFLLEDEPLLGDINLDHYVYMGRSTVELRKSAENYFNIAYSFGEKEDYIKEIENYNKALELNPGYEDAWKNKGIALRNLKQYEEAIKCYDKALELNPKDEDAWKSKGIAFSNMGKYEEAIKCYDKALELNPKDEDAWKSKGIAFSNMGKYEKAIKCYDKALELDPGYERAWNNKGIAFSNMGKYEKAIKCYDKALELDPGYERAWNNKGKALRSLGKYEEAMKCYDKALELDPKDEDAWNKRGKALHSLGKYEEAIICYNRALELDPKDEDAWNKKGKALHSLGKYEKAIKCYDKALELNPKDEDAWNNKGKALHSLGKYEKAIKCYDKALELNPKDEYAWNNKGIAFDDLGKYEKAIKCYDKALELNPKDEYAWNKKGIALRSLGKYERAIICYNKALELNPGYEKAWNNKGVALDDLREYEEAMKCYNRALELDPTYKNAWNNKGNLLRALGRKEEAERCFQEAKELNH